jgi:hypothetical protein
MVSPPQLKFFYSNTDIQNNGDNTGTIFNPTCLVHTGESFCLEAGQSVMIVPFQPDQCTPWKIFKSALFDHRFYRNKSPRYLCYILTNQWIYRSVIIQRGTMLSWLLGHPGIHHTMGYMSAYDLTHLKRREHVRQQDENEDEDEDEEEEKEDQQHPPQSDEVDHGNNHRTHLAQALNKTDSRSFLSTPGVCHVVGVSRCCHHVDII